MLSIGFKMFKHNLKIVLITLFSILATYYVAVLLHEYSHAMMAWILGYKKSPFDIYIGNFLLLPVSESVNYHSILASGHGQDEAIIGISGITMTVVLFLISLFILKSQFILKKILFLSFVFWLADINLMEIFSYINRTFVMGDIGEFVQGLAISPLVIFIPGLIFVGWGLYRFYKVEIIKMYRLLPIKSTVMRRFYLWITFWPLVLTVVYWGQPIGWRVLSLVTNITSLLLVISILILCDPSRSWVREQAK